MITFGRRETNKHDAIRQALHDKMRRDLMDKQFSLLQAGQFKKNDVLVQFNPAYNTSKNSIIG